MRYAKIISHNGSPAISVDGRALPPMAFTLLQDYNPEYLKGLGGAGIEVYFVSCRTDWSCLGSFDDFAERARRLLEAVPNAKIFLRLSVDPPEDWVRAHPDEIMRYEDGSTIPAAPYGQKDMLGMCALSSRAWRDDMTPHIRAFLDRVDESPYSDAVIGAFLTAGGTGEWYPNNKLTIREGDGVGYYVQGYEKSERNRVADFSPAFRTQFSSYLREKYGTDEALRKAWRDPEARIDEPAIPTFDERIFVWADGDKPATPEADGDGPSKPARSMRDQLFEDTYVEASDNAVGSFLNTDKYQKTADFYRAFHLGAADTIIHFARAIKAHRPGTLVGAFYGYFGCIDYYNMCMCAGGHRVLESGCVDMTACPNIYMERQPGAYSAQRVMQDSFRLHNAIFFSEDDTRTHRDLKNYREQMETYDMRDTANVLKRDFGRNVCQDLFGWWFDMVSTGRFKHTEMYALLARQQEIFRAAYGMDRRKHTEIAVLYDEESVHCTGAGTLWQMIETYRTLELPRAGAPMDFYYHNDLSLDNMPEYKLYIFANCFSLSDADRAAIEKRVKKAGKTALFLYGQGFINPDRERRLDAENMRELTGMRVRRIDQANLMKFKVTNHPAMAECDPDRVFGKVDYRLLDGCSLGVNDIIPVACPLLVPDDPDMELLGQVCENGLPALAMKREGGFTSVLAASKWLDCNILRAVARLAGCHIYAEDGDFVFANPNFVTVHAKTSGHKTITLPKACDPFEVYEKRAYGAGTDRIECDMYRGETKMFCLRGAV